MRVIFGVGNPGKKYEKTRHNIGFEILDKIAESKGLNFNESKNDYLIAGSDSFTSPFFLVKPTTYVNLSGNAAVDIIENFNCAVEDFLVVVDDLNLSPGTIRLRKSGGDGGHNGLISIIYSLEKNNFPRLRFGIGNDFEDGEMAKFVLSKFDDEQLKVVIPAIDYSVELINEFIVGGFSKMADKFSKDKSLTNNES